MTKTRRPSPARPADTSLRIIGGNLRGSRIEYQGDPRTRPMKERIREATFNLVGPSIKGTYAIDLFAGTGALALEAISRGAVGATAIEQHFPTARLIEQNAVRLKVAQQITVVPGDTFVWIRQLREQLQEGELALPAMPGPWTVFCSPPYRFYNERREDMLALVQQFCDDAPPDSTVVVEAECEWNFDQLPLPEQWDVRAYRPAMLAILRI